jgi:hypothetical protein
MTGRHPFDLLGGRMRAMIEAAQERERLHRSMMPSLALSDGIDAALRDMRARQQVLNSIMGPADHARMLQDALGGMQHLPQLQPFASRMQLENHQWQRLVERLERERRFTTPRQAMLLESWSTWQSASEQMARALATHQDALRSVSVLAHITAPLDLFSRYARSAVVGLEERGDELETVAATTALSLANDQVTESSALGTLLIDDEKFEPTESGATSDGVSVLDLPESALLFYVQQRQLVARGPAILTLSPGELLLVPPAARLAERAHHVAQLVCECNRAAKFRGSEEIFKPTTTLLESIVGLPLIVVVDRESLGRFVDCLFFALYEGAGDEKLRFMAKHGGVYEPTDPQCNLLWAVKFLRNKTMRHDPDHGGERKIEKSWSDLKESLAKLGIDAWPVTSDDFTGMQEVLLHETVAFLSELLYRLAQGDASEVRPAAT